MNKLMSSSSPHVHSPSSTRRIMLDVIIALLPTTVMGIIIFGIRSLLVVASCAIAAVLSEFIFNKITKREETVGDLSALLTGLLLGLNLHANAPIWQAVIGSVFAIIVVKCLFGGIGSNFANPAITGRVFILVSFSGALGGGAIPKISRAPELVSGATPLEAMKTGADLPSLLDMFLGLRGGAIGEACILALLLGFVYLVVRRVIFFETPLIFIGTVFALSLIASGDATLALYQIMSGGLVIGAVFMATDYVTTPLTRSGKMIFSFGAGVITFLIRQFGAYPEGVSFAILIMNIVSPYIEKLTLRKALGGNYK